MNVIHYPARVRRVGPFGLPRYEVLVLDHPLTGFGHIEIIWGYRRPWFRAYG